MPTNDGTEAAADPAVLAETLAALRVDEGRGLREDEIAARRRENGYNEVPEPRRQPLLTFLAKFWGLSAWMLELILLLSAWLRKYSDLAVVAALLLVNAVLGFLQEERASAVVLALRRRLQITARVLRDGNWRLLPSRELVPGDVVRLRPGDIVPADVRLLSGELAIDQSSLTGESAEVDRVRGQVLPSGSLVRRGEGNGVVILIGARTAFGRTAELVQQARPRLHIEAVVARVVRWLFLIVGGLLALVTVLSLLRGEPLVELASLMLVLLMSAVPVALPVMFTVSMAFGSRELAKRGVLVTRLSASEDAATMDVLCVDKTGTITLNRLAVRQVIPTPPASEDDVLRAGALASQEANQDPIDRAFLAAARERAVASAAPTERVVSFRPFDPASRRTEAVVERDGERRRVMKGALRTIAAACGLAPAATEALEARARAAAIEGQRTLAVAEGPEGGEPVLLGLVLLHDPPRPDAGALIAALQGLGVGVKLLTGDGLAVAGAIGRSVGLPRIRPLAELREKGTTAAVDGFAEVFPEDKYKVVQRLQAEGHVCGMTGDGVNDAPALRQAEVGIAVASATDVAKGAASVVLTDPGLTNIVALVEQGRTIYQRVLTWIINKISRTILKAAFVAIAYVVTGRFVVSAFGMLLLTFMTDFAKIALATDRVRPSPRPESWRIGRFVVLSALLGGVMVAEALGLLALGWTRAGLVHDEGLLHTFGFLTLLYFAAFSILSARERRPFWASRPSATLAGALLADVLVGTALTRLGLPGLAPLPWWPTLALFGSALVACLGVNDALKVLLLGRLFAGEPARESATIAE